MPTSRNWTNEDIPNLNGKIVIVTGGNKGLGYKSVLELAKKSANVIIACRNVEEGLSAKTNIISEVPAAKVDVIPMDLTDQTSIRNFCEEFKQRYCQLDILLLNAGVVNLDSHQLTNDGQEMHMATNHLGHFALTGRLFDILKNTEHARVITVSSLAYKSGVINFDDFSWNMRKYDRFKAYGDSKLANLLFMTQLQKQFERAGSSALSVSAHPGLTGTERQQSIGIGGIFTRWIASPVSKGCLPQLLAATEPSVKANDFYGPKYRLLGPPKQQKLQSKFFNPEVAKKLWKYSEELTGVRFGEVSSIP